MIRSFQRVSVLGWGGNDTPARYSNYMTDTQVSMQVKCEEVSVKNTARSA
jgi:hypothetical protein